MHNNQSETALSVKQPCSMLDYYIFLINDLISCNKFDFMFLSDTWLDAANGAVILTDSAAAHFTFTGCHGVDRKVEE